MSRCFPFPPPGYEKKIKTDEAALLTKEKHKKSKKDREKKEGKEKKHKERSKDKHKEKKEKKEKHDERKDKDRDKEKSRTSEEKKVEVLPDTRDTVKLVTNTLQKSNNGDSRFVQDLATRIRDGEAATGSQSEQKTITSDRRNVGLTGRTVQNKSFYPVQETNLRRDAEKRINPQRNFAVAKSAENVAAQVSFGSSRKITEAMCKPTERKDQEKQKETPEKNKRKESAVKSDKPRDREGLNKSEPRDKDRNKEKKEEEAEVVNQVDQEKTKFVEGGPRLKERDKDSLDTRNSKPPDLSKASNKNLTSEGNLGKRKDLERNGFLHENGFNRPNKLQRPAASPISSGVGNGRKLGPTRTELQSVETKTPPKSASEQQGTSCRPDVKDHRVNGFVGSRELKAVPLNSLAAPVKVQVKENGEASVTLPHPDLKYLNQILGIPEREELPRFDDQEWLFDDSTVKSKKPRTDETREVWDQAFRIESADIAALPYVVPF
ncbi:PREDICTED: myb-like protein X [Tarenaya hassleriana]|uniref:myb-like protein X n=1 Tax=Tarenaya hassleriana TaxID=28532 RepID=UPI00053C4EB9|nr:PREDICTED: myb-like protein X [Tarenaya hassleriana]XP_010552029.1 PREDICTED: myb-like protein X [Tarenaya hassleriana]XP_010552030.1 PREDICTED: myb-like protein X [Tarenaya hassleriana]